jgi:anti-anti-sigma factor
MTNNLTWEKTGRFVVFRFHGSIESEVTPEIRQEILTVLRDEDPAAAVFHMGDATYIDSMGIGMFVNIHVQNHNRTRFLFCDLSGSVSKTFGYVKLISFFDIRDSLDDALKELNRDHQ